MYLLPMYLSLSPRITPSYIRRRRSLLELVTYIFAPTAFHFPLNCMCLYIGRQADKQAGLLLEQSLRALSLPPLSSSLALSRSPLANNYCSLPENDLSKGILMTLRATTAAAAVRICQLFMRLQCASLSARDARVMERVVKSSRTLLLFHTVCAGSAIVCTTRGRTMRKETFSSWRRCRCIFLRKNRYVLPYIPHPTH